MGGAGSGRYYRYGSRTTTDDVKSIDIRRLRRWDNLPSSRNFRNCVWGTFQWTRGERVTAEVGYEVNQSTLELNFSYQHGSEPWEKIDQSIRFDRTFCHFGGVRYWFLCPHCSGRVAVLYLGGSRFLCRHCYALPYGSQREDH